MTPLYIFDLDGTLALIEHRRHLVDAKCTACNGEGHQVALQPASADPFDAAGAWVELKTPCPDCAGTGKAKPDWPAFFAACVRDEPNWPVISTMRALLKSGADIWIWSGRSAVVMNETLAWLHRWVCGDEIDSDELQLMMRREGDHTPDEQLKAGWLDGLSEFDRRRLVAVFDDRDKVVAMWRSKGVACFQVTPGAF